MIAQLVAEVLEMLFGEAAFEKSARIHARRSVALEVNEVARLAIVGAVEEMVEADFDQRRQRSVGGDVAADVVVVLVGADHHGQRVPADEVLDAPFELTVAGIRDLSCSTGIVLMYGVTSLSGAVTPNSAARSFSRCSR